MLHGREMLTGFGLGAGLMYFLDPARGAGRRAKVRDQFAHARRIARDAAGRTRRDVAHRAQGIGARVRGRIEGGDADDHVLVERVRSRIGRVVSHPHAITVIATDGVVTLNGPVLQAEINRLLNAVEGVRGVRDVLDHLQVYEHAGNVPALQGGRTPARLSMDMWRREWSPSTRLMTGAAGVALAVYGAARRDTAGTLLAASGVCLLARAATNRKLKRLTGIGAGRRAVDEQKRITVNAPDGLGTERLAPHAAQPQMH